MQKELDEELMTYKYLADFDVQREHLYRNLSIYDLRFHLMALREYRDKA